MRRETRHNADGNEEIISRMICPVGGQIGPAVTGTGKNEGVAIAEALEAWNVMIARVRPLEA
ncbi:MAG: hypothetical protein ACYDHM_02625 [Acidiferrobacterales bacterium]